MMESFLHGRYGGRGLKLCHFFRKVLIINEVDKKQMNKLLSRVIDILPIFMYGAVAK